MSRERIIARVVAAGLSAGDVTPAGEAPSDRGVARIARAADVVDLFVSRARDLGVEVAIAGSLEDAAGLAESWCAARRVQRAAVWDVPDLAPALARLRAAGVSIVGPGATARDVAGAAAGITGAQWGVAETGTVVLASSPRQPRLASLLPPAHLVVLRADRILPDLAALFAACGPLPSALTFISGPSRSADIALVPVLGAHGPMEVSVVLVS